MGSKTSSLLRPDEIQDLSEKTGFTAREIVRLYNRFAYGHIICDMYIVYMCKSGVDPAEIFWGREVQETFAANLVHA